MLRLTVAFLCLMVVPTHGVSQEASPDTARVAALIAADLAQREHPLVVRDEGIGRQVARALETEAVAKRPDPECPYPPSTARETGLGVVVHLKEISGTEAVVDVEISCHYDNLLGGYYGLVRYELIKVQDQWELVGKETIIES